MKKVTIKFTTDELIALRDVLLRYVVDHNLKNIPNYATKCAVAVMQEFYIDVTKKLLVYNPKKISVAFSAKTAFAFIHVMEMIFRNADVTQFSTNLLIKTIATLDQGFA